MCQYRYVYYANCRHAEFYLVSYCSEARARAGISRIATPCRDATGGAQPPLHHSERRDSPNSSRSQEEEQTTLKGASGREATVQHHQAKDAVEHIEPPQQRTPPRTWASIARAAATDTGTVRKSGLSKGAPCATSTETAPSPAARLAARFEHDSSTSAVVDIETSRAYYRSTPSTSGKKQGKGKRVERGRSSSPPSTTPRHGRHGSDQTIRAEKRAQVNKQSQPDVNSSTDFPQLSPHSSIGRSSHTSDRARSDSSTSWAQIAKLTSASRPNRSSTSDPTADSDAGTVSTSLSSFQSDPFDYVLPDKVDSQNMAPDHHVTMAKTIRFRRPAPTNINVTQIQETPRKRLPAEWTWSATSSPEKATPTVTKRKSAGTIGAAWNSPNESPGTRSKSPTKTMPFELATARRAAVREQREKTGTAAKVVPIVPKTLTKAKKSLRSHSKTASCDSTSTAQLHTATHSPFPSSSSQSFATAPEDPHNLLSPSGSPSRIPRLAIRVGRRDGPRTSESEPSPIRSSVRAEVTVSETASEPQGSIQRTPSPPAYRVEDVGDNDISLETIKPEGDVESIASIGEEQGKNISAQDARSEMAESDAAIKRARVIVRNIQSEEHVDPHVHFPTGMETTDNAPGLGIRYGSLVTQSEGSQAPNELPWAGWDVPDHLEGREEWSQTPSSQTQLALQPAQECAAIPEFDASGGEAKFELAQSNETEEVEKSQREGTQTPETIGTWPDISGFSGTHGTLDSSTEHFDERREGTVSSQSGYRRTSASSVRARSASVGLLVVGKHTQTFIPGNRSQPSSQYGRERSSSNPNITSEIMVHPDNTRHLNPEFNLGESSVTGSSVSTRTVSLQGNMTAPSKLNAQAQEFVPGSASAIGSTHGHARPQILPEWADTGFGSLYASQQPYDKGISQQFPSHGPHDLVGSGKRKHKKSPQKSPNKSCGNFWQRSADNPTNTNAPPVILARTSGNRWNIPNVSSADQNTTDGQWRRPTEQRYTGRGGSNTRVLPGPDGKTPLQRWWQDSWKSVGGGPLTLASVYEHLNEQATINQPQRQEPSSSMHPRPAVETEELADYVGYGMIKPCGNVNMIGAYEALPHYPLLCKTCQPDFHH